MRLADYLVVNELTHAEFAKLIGVHVTTVYRVCTGVTFPKESTLKAIAAKTKGAVTANDFMNMTKPEPRTGIKGRPRAQAPEAVE